MTTPDSTSTTPEPQGKSGSVMGKPFAACVGAAVAFFFSMASSKFALMHFVFNELPDGVTGYYPIAFFMQNLVLSLPLYGVFFLLFFIVGRNAYRATFLALILAVALTTVALAVFYGAVEAGRDLGGSDVDDISAPVRLGR